MTACCCLVSELLLKGFIDETYYRNNTTRIQNLIYKKDNMTMSKSIFLVALVTLLLATSSTAFTGISSSRALCSRSQYVVSRTQVDAVIDVGSESAFDKTIQASGDSLVIVDYSTTWCGPCKGACSRFRAVRCCHCAPLWFVMWPQLCIIRTYE